MSIGFWSNERRNCYVQESGIDPDFKQTVYPYLNELDQLQNEIFSSVKELYYKFANDATIRTVSSHVNRNVYNDLTLKFVEEIEAVLPKMTELKQQFITTLQNHVRESGRGLDEEVSFAMGKLHAAKGPIEKRVQDVVVKYNFKASLARKEQADLMIQEYFRKAPLEVPEPEETLKDQPAVEAAPVTMQAVVTRNRQRGETIEFRTDGRAAAEFQPREQAQDQGGADDEIDENISDEKFNDIKSKVKLIMKSALAHNFEPKNNVKVIIWGQEDSGKTAFMINSMKMSISKKSFEATEHVFREGGITFTIHKNSLPFKQQNLNLTLSTKYEVLLVFFDTKTRSQFEPVTECFRSVDLRRKDIQTVLLVSKTSYESKQRAKPTYKLHCFIDQAD